MNGWQPAGAEVGTPHGLLTWFGAREHVPVPPHDLFVVATQTLEVGANLDFEGMVAECASLDALRQRFGRLDRLGRFGRARGAILVRSDQAAPSGGEDADPIYGTALAATWQWLQAAASDGHVDMGVEALGDRIAVAQVADPHLLSRLSAPSPHAPILLPAYLDVLAQTAPVPQPDVSVPLLLHGPERGAADVQVCWRADLPLPPGLPDEKLGPLWLDTLALAPPAAGECVSVPLHVFRRWAAGERDAMREETDVEGGRIAEENEKSIADHPASPLRFVRWAGPEDSELVSDLGALRPGDTVVVSVSAGGLGELCHLPEPPPPSDRGDEAGLSARGRAVLRLHPATLLEWLPGGAGAALGALSADPTTGDLYTDDEWIDTLRKQLRVIADGSADPSPPRWLRDVSRFLAASKRLEVRLHPGGWVNEDGQVRPNPGGLVLTAPGRVAGWGERRDDLPRRRDGVGRRTRSAGGPLPPRRTAGGDLCRRPVARPRAGGGSGDRRSIPRCRQGRSALPGMASRR